MGVNTTSPTAYYAVRSHPSRGGRGKVHCAACYRAFSGKMCGIETSVGYTKLDYCENSFGSISSEGNLKAYCKVVIVGNG